MWMIYLGLINLVLIIISLMFFIPKDVLKTNIKSPKFDNIFKDQLPYLIIIFLVVAIHIIEVEFIDSNVTQWINHD